MSEYTEDIWDALVAAAGDETILVCAQWLDEVSGYRTFLSDVGMPPDETYSLVFVGAANWPFDADWNPRTCSWGRDTSLDNCISPRRQRRLDRNGGADPRKSVRPTLTVEGLA